MNIPNTNGSHITHSRDGINWTWIWYAEELDADNAVANADHFRTCRDKTEDNEQGYCVAFHV